MKKKSIAVLMLSLLGILLSIYSLVLFYNPSFGSICDLSQTFSCSSVAKSDYSSIWGVPIAAIGVIGYIIIFLIAITMVKAYYNNSHVSHKLKKLLIVLSFIAVLFTVYLTYIEAFAIKTFCPVCLLSALTIVLIFIFSILLHKKPKTNQVGNLNI